MLFHNATKRTHLQCCRVMCVGNTEQKKEKKKTHLHSNCNITDAERETIFIWSKSKRIERREKTVSDVGHPQ